LEAAVTNKISHEEHIKFTESQDLWNTGKSSFMALCKLGFIMDQYS
jgi:hypothetical protein